MSSITGIFLKSFVHLPWPHGKHSALRSHCVSLCQVRRWCNSVQKLLCRSHGTVCSISLFPLKPRILFVMVLTFRFVQDIGVIHCVGMPRRSPSPGHCSRGCCLGTRVTLWEPFARALFCTYSQYSWAATSDLCISVSLFSNGCHTYVLLPHTMCLINAFRV